MRVAHFIQRYPPALGGSEAYFAASGPAYLLQSVNTSSSVAGTMTFTWNQPTTVTAPPASQTYTG